MDKKVVELYTDGSSRGNPGPAGYGLILKYGRHEKEYSEGFRKSTNNRMELLAVIKGLELLTSPSQNVTVFSDSKYVVDAVEKNWLTMWVKKGFKNVKNPDLWQRYLRVSQKHTISMIWIKGHNNHAYNERCDKLAVNAALTPSAIDEYYEQMDKNSLGF